MNSTICLTATLIGIRVVVGGWKSLVFTIQIRKPRQSMSIIVECVTTKNHFFVVTHDRRKYILPKSVVGADVAPIGKVTYSCVECTRCTRCPHGKLKFNCVECTGYPHGKSKSYCKECGGSGLCKAPKCETRGNPNYEGHCLRCFVNLFPGKKNKRNYKTKETAVGDHLIEKFPGVAWTLDKPVQDGCSKRRPDLFLDMGSHVVIVEVDENKHDTYDCTCENRRLMEISKDVSHRPLAMVRFNPDGYVCLEKGEIPSPWAYTKSGVCKVRPKWKKPWEARLEALSETVGYWTKNKSDKLIEVGE